MTRPAAFVSLLALLVTVPSASNARRAAPARGDVIINEYAADNDANGNDFFELLVLGDGVDLRGLRITDNELVKGVLNNGEAVFTLGQDAYLSKVPQGTLIAVWTAAKGVATDTQVNPATGDWKLVLAPGTGVTVGADGLGGVINPGLANGGDALYVYLPGPDGSSGGTDNVYLDFVAWEEGARAEAPPGLAHLVLPKPANNAYFTGNTAANDDPAGWVRYDSGPAAKPTPGEPNPTQNLATLRRR
jgi:hypothetical protein